MAWYNVYRPQTFDEVVGQNLVKTVLQNALAKNSIKHAYLFSGPKGTGKTTLARIFAHSLNQVSDNPQTSIDIVEMDAASNTGIDDIRQLIENAKNPPIAGQYKIYIIDEVHMLSKSAMNALLKILEEPPQYLIFLLATTNPEKLLPTVLSRLTKLQLTNHSIEGIITRLQYIAAAEHVIIEVPALELIARRSSGGQRDAINLLETVASYGLDAYTESDVAAILGVLPIQQLQAVATALMSDEVQHMAMVSGMLSQSGVDGDAVLAGLLEWLLDESFAGHNTFDSLIVPVSQVIALQLPVAHVTSTLSIVRAYMVQHLVPFQQVDPGIFDTLSSHSVQVEKKMVENTSKPDSAQKISPTASSLDVVDSHKSSLKPTSNSASPQKKQTSEAVSQPAGDAPQTFHPDPDSQAEDTSDELENLLELDEETDSQNDQSQPEPIDQVKQSQPVPQHPASTQELADSVAASDPELSTQSASLQPATPDQNQTSPSSISADQVEEFVRQLSQNQDCPTTFKMLAPDLGAKFQPATSQLTLSVSSGIFQSALNSDKLQQWIAGKIEAEYGMQVHISTQVRSHRVVPADKPVSAKNADSIPVSAPTKSTSSPDNTALLPAKKSDNPADKLKFTPRPSGQDTPPQIPLEVYDDDITATTSDQSSTSTPPSSTTQAVNHTQQAQQHGDHFYRVYKKLPENMEGKGVEVKQEDVELPKKTERSFEEEAEDIFEFE